MGRKSNGKMSSSESISGSGAGCFVGSGRRFLAGRSAMVANGNGRTVI